MDKRLKKKLAEKKCVWDGTHDCGEKNSLKFFPGLSRFVKTCVKYESS